MGSGTQRVRGATNRDSAAARLLHCLRCISAGEFHLTAHTRSIPVQRTRIMFCYGHLAQRDVRREICAAWGLPREGQCLYPSLRQVARTPLGRTGAISGDLLLIVASASMGQPYCDNEMAIYSPFVGNTGEIGTVPTTRRTTPSEPTGRPVVVLFRAPNRTILRHGNILRLRRGCRLRQCMRAPAVKHCSHAHRLFLSTAVV